MPRKLGVNDKDYNNTEIKDDDFRRDWVSKLPFSPRNRHPEVTANQEDHGFDHLNIPTSSPVFYDPPKPPAFNFSDEEAQIDYLDCIRKKLTMAKNYILKEKELGLDPDRPNMQHEPSVILLGEGPIKIGMHSLHNVRLLMDEDTRFERLSREKHEDDPEMQQPMQDYLVLWTQLRADLAWQIYGETEKEKENLADGIMEEVLHEKWVNLSDEPIVEAPK